MRWWQQLIVGVAAVLTVVLSWVLLVGALLGNWWAIGGFVFGVSFGVTVGVVAWALEGIE